MKSTPKLKTKREHDHATTKTNIRFVRALLRSGHPMYRLDYDKNMAINHLAFKDSNVSDDALYKVISDHISAGFDVLKKPQDVVGREHESFWQVLFTSQRINAQILGLLEKSLCGKLTVENLQEVGLCAENRISLNPETKQALIEIVDRCIKDCEVRKAAQHMFIYRERMRHVEEQKASASPSTMQGECPFPIEKLTEKQFEYVRKYL